MKMEVVNVGDWRGIALRGIVAMLFGVVTLVWPGLTLTALVLLFGAFALVGGLFTIAAVITQLAGTGSRRSVMLFDGIVSVIIGVVTFAWPNITALALLYLIAAWAFLTGAMEVAAAVRLRAVLRHEWLLGLAGVASIIFAALLVITPGAGALVITWLIGWYALFFGALLLALAWQIHRLQSPRDPATSPFRQAAV
jgi:uncharacterized membrane protein HdeD (DUF308 family)